MGSIYHRPRSPFLWIKYYVNARPVRESTGTAKATEAREILKKREGAVAEGKPVSPRLDRIRYGEARADLLAYYEATGSRDLAEAGHRLRHLDAMFAGRRLASIAPADAHRYTVQRREEGAADGTIRRELSTLTTMLSLAAEHGKLLRVPKLRKPKDGPPRQGFFEPEQYAAVRRHLSPDLQVATDIAYTLGWRMRSEVLALERRHVDLEAGTLRLDATMTKTDQGRVVYLTPELAGRLGEQLARVDALQKRLGRIIPALFPYLSGPRRQGRPRRDFRKAWVTACRGAGVPGKLRHDFRRTAVRNMVTTQGITERVAMAITGHETRRVFDAYHIVSPGDLQAAAVKMAGTLPGTQTPAAAKGVAVNG